MSLGRRLAAVVLLLLLGVCVGRVIPPLKWDTHLSLWYAVVSGSIAAALIAFLCKRVWSVVVLPLVGFLVVGGVAFPIFLWFLFEPVSWGCGVDVRNDLAQELRVCVVNPVDESAEWSVVRPGATHRIGLYSGSDNDDYYRTSVCLLTADAGRRVLRSQIIDGHFLDRLPEPKVLGLLPAERDTEAAKWSFRLDKQGYDAHTNSLLFAVHSQPRPGHSIPMIVNLTTGIRELPRTLDVSTLGLAYSPSESLFAIMYGKRFVLYSQARNGAKTYYQGRFVWAPTHYLYNHCAWSTGGTWLAVGCFNLRHPEKVKALGLYNSATDRFLVTDIPYAAYVDPWWQNDQIVWVPNNDHAKVVDLGAGSPRVIREVSFTARGRLLGVLSGKPVVLQDGRRLVLGEQFLSEFGDPVDRKVIVTPAYVLVASLEGQLRAYDSSGNLVGTGNAAGDIRFGSCGGTPEEVYAVCDSNRLVRISVGKTGEILVREMGALALPESCDAVPVVYPLRRSQPTSSPAGKK